MFTITGLRSGERYTVGVIAGVVHQGHIVGHVHGMRFKMARLHGFGHFEYITDNDGYANHHLLFPAAAVRMRQGQKHSCRQAGQVQTVTPITGCRHWVYIIVPSNILKL